MNAILEYRIRTGHAVSALLVTALVGPIQAECQSNLQSALEGHRTSILQSGQVLGSINTRLLSIAETYPDYVPVVSALMRFSDQNGVLNASFVIDLWTRTLPGDSVALRVAKNAIGYSKGQSVMAVSHLVEFMAEIESNKLFMPRALHEIAAEIREQHRLIQDGYDRVVQLMETRGEPNSRRRDS